MDCPVCHDVQDVDESGGVYVIRKCANCGRAMKVREAGDHGRGIRIRSGDQVVVPPEVLAFAANPLRSKGHLTKHGINFFAGLAFVGDIHERKNEFLGITTEIQNACTVKLKASPILEDVDFEDENQACLVYGKLKEHKNSQEWFAYVSATYLSIVQDAIAAEDATTAAWATACAERFRSLSIFKEHFEDVVWMGHSAKRLTDLLDVWDQNKSNSDEEFWQSEFQNHAFAFAQLFSVPITLIKGKAYVGGQDIDRNDARFVDFLFSSGSASEAVLVEIKTPTTSLIESRRYRTSVHAPSRELVGSVVQVSDYKRSLHRELGNLMRNSKHALDAFNPKAVIVIGNSSQLDTPKKRDSFELFRSGLSGIDVVTFDELFLKLEHMASLFSLVRTAV